MHTPSKSAAIPASFSLILMTFPVIKLGYAGTKYSVPRQCAESRFKSE